MDQKLRQCKCLPVEVICGLVKQQQASLAAAACALASRTEQQPSQSNSHLHMKQPLVTKLSLGAHQYCRFAAVLSRRLRGTHDSALHHLRNHRVLTLSVCDESNCRGRLATVFQLRNCDELYHKHSHWLTRQGMQKGPKDGVHPNAQSLSPTCTNKMTGICFAS